MPICKSMTTSLDDSTKDINAKQGSVFVGAVLTFTFETRLLNSEERETSTNKV